jgi:hypothetical protein
MTGNTSKYIGVLVVNLASQDATSPLAIFRVSKFIGIEGRLSRERKKIGSSANYSSKKVLPNQLEQIMSAPALEYPFNENESQITIKGLGCWWVNKLFFKDLVTNLSLTIFLRQNIQREIIRLPGRETGAVAKQLPQSYFVLVCGEVTYGE